MFVMIADDDCAVKTQLVSLSDVASVTEDANGWAVLHSFSGRPYHSCVRYQRLVEALSGLGALLG